MNLKQLYAHDDIGVKAECAGDAAVKNIERCGINIYLGTYGDDGSNTDIHIDPKDTGAIELFRAFAKQIANHFNNAAHESATND